MKNKATYIVIAIVVILVGGYLLYDRNHQAQAPIVNEQSSPIVNNNQVSANSNLDIANPPANQTAPATNSNNHFSNETDVTGQNKVVEVDFNGTSFSPSTINIKAGDTVVFKNKSNNDFWPASNPHPIHTDYPGFDALGPVGPGKIYQFIFSNVGSWGYHDHLNPAVHGTVVVTQ